MGAETSQKLARVLERKHYLLMSAQVKCREEEEEGGKMFWLTENKRKRKKCKENIIPGFFFSLNQRWHFPPAFQTMPSHCVFACPFFCCSGVSAKRERVKINQRNHTFPTTILLFLTCIWAHCEQSWHLNKMHNTRHFVQDKPPNLKTVKCLWDIVFTCQGTKTFHAGVSGYDNMHRGRFSYKTCYARDLIWGWVAIMTDTISNNYAHAPLIWNY